MDSTFCLITFAPSTHIKLWEYFISNKSNALHKDFSLLKRDKDKDKQNYIRSMYKGLG